MLLYYLFASFFPIFLFFLFCFVFLFFFFFQAEDGIRDPLVTGVQTCGLPISRALKVLPPRLDLAYKVYLGTQGFLIGDATYRFEHEGGTYRIATVAQARGLAALVVHGRGKEIGRASCRERG